MDVMPLEKFMDSMKMTLWEMIGGGEWKGRKFVGNLKKKFVSQLKGGFKAS